MHETESSWDGANAAKDPRIRNLPSRPTKSANSPCPLRPLSRKTEIAAPTLWGKSRRKGVRHQGPPNMFEEDFLTECNEDPTQDWQRCWNV